VSQDYGEKSPKLFGTSLTATDEAWAVDYVKFVDLRNPRNHALITNLTEALEHPPYLRLRFCRRKWRLRHRSSLTVIFSQLIWRLRAG
jgi:predicted SPOUT superfamily RNA methylase MTH1